MIWLGAGYHLAFWLAAGLVAVAIVIAVTVLQPEPAVIRRVVAAPSAAASRPRAERVLSEAC